MCSSAFRKPVPIARYTWLSILVALLTLTLNGCGGGASVSAPVPVAETTVASASNPITAVSAPSNLLSTGPVKTYSNVEVVQKLQLAIAGKVDMTAMSAANQKPMNDFLADLQQHDGQVTSRRATYASVDAQLRPIELTAGIYAPVTSARKTFPIVIYIHGTELDKQMVASNDNGAEAMIGAAAALTGGLVVAMPDMPGMGQCTPDAYHPYCHGASLARGCADMLPATMKFMQDNEIPWSGEVFVVGYSEGGYAAMATLRELQTDGSRYGTFKLRGGFFGAPPCSLSTTMRQMMLADKTFGAPFFLPYIIMGYNAVYANSVFNPARVFVPQLTQYQLGEGSIYEWMNGAIGGDAADAKIATRMGVSPGRVVPLNMMNPDWVAAQLADNVYQTSIAGRRLMENDLDKGWKPNDSVKVFMFHAYDDDMVPYQNSDNAYNEFQRLGAKQVAFLPWGSRGDGTTHVQGAMIGLPMAFTWVTIEANR